MIVPRPFGTPALRNCAARPAPSTTSGVAIGKKSRRLIVERARNRYLTSAMAMSVPSAVAMIVAMTPTRMLVPKAAHTPCAWHTLIQLSKVKPTQTMFDLTESLNENTNV